MGILYLATSAFLTCFCRYIHLSVLFSHKLPYTALCLLRYTRGICTQISDNTNSPVSLYINSFIKLLCNPHRLGSSKVKGFGSLLLQCTGGKYNRSLLKPFPLLYVCNRKVLTLKIFHNLLQLFLRSNRDFSFLGSIEFCV